MMWLLRDADSNGDVFYRNVARETLVWTGIPARAARFMFEETAQHVADDVFLEHKIKLIPVRWFDTPKTEHDLFEQVRLAKFALLMSERPAKARITKMD